MEKYNKRSFFRVELTLPVKWRALSAEETELIKKGAGYDLLTRNLIKNELCEDVSSIKNDDRISQAFQLLNNKLDYIIKTISKESETASPKDRIVEISASGLKFSTKEEVCIGGFLKMSLLFSGSPQIQIELVAEAMRIQKICDDSLVAANIIIIDDKAKDFLIKLIFEKQRTDIRRIKTNMGVAGNDSDVK